MRTNELLLKLRNGDELNFQNQLLLILKLSFPSIVAQLSSIIMSFIDASMVGHLGSSQAASIGLVASSTWLILVRLIDGVHCAVRAAHRCKERKRSAESREKCPFRHFVFFARAYDNLHRNQLSSSALAWCKLGNLP